MLIGYARVSTQDQTLDLQKGALQKKIGRTKIFTDTASGSLAERPGLNEALQFLRSSITLVRLCRCLLSCTLCRQLPILRFDYSASATLDIRTHVLV